MAGLQLLEPARKNLRQIFEFLAQRDPVKARKAVNAILTSLEVLKQMPMLGRPLPDRKRELLIGKRHAAYIAIYRYEAATDTVFVLEIRNQRQLPSS